MKTTSFDEFKELARRGTVVAGGNGKMGAIVTPGSGVQDIAQPPH